MTSVITATEADRALKAKHQAMWAQGNYPELAADLIWNLGDVVADAAEIRPGDTVLDVAAGSGNVAIRAAQRGAAVVASDLTPEMFDDGRARAREAGVQVTWEYGDAEDLPYPDASFDVVTSCVGVMFAPHHQAAADELLRVCRPGGQIALLSWTPTGFIGQMFAAMKPYAPPPPAGAQPPVLWGDEEHVRALFGDRVTRLRTRRGRAAIDRFSAPEDFREYFKSYYGPTITAYKFNAENPAAVAGLDAALADLGRQHLRGRHGLRMEWEYLLVTAVRVD
jgi:SAM-dependent methyltransferase